VTALLLRVRAEVRERFRSWLAVALPAVALRSE